MHFRPFPTQMSITLCQWTDYIWTMQESLATICGLNSRRPLNTWDEAKWKKSKTSKSIISMSDIPCFIDSSLWMMPCWRGLNHFEEALSVSYTDGQKFEDLSKVCVNQFDNYIHWHRQVIVFACYDVLTHEDCKDGYIHLCCLQAYIEFDLYTAFEVHTMHTLTAGWEALSTLNTLIQVNFIYFLIFMLTSVLGRHTPRRHNRDLKRIGTSQKTIQVCMYLMI